MIKELSVFFSDPLRRIIARAKGKCPAGVSAALNLLHNVQIEMVSGWRMSSLSDEELERLYGPLWKFFDPSHNEGAQVRDAFGRASSVKVHIGSLGGVYVDLIMCFYAGKEEISFFMWKVVFTRRGGKMAYSTYSSGPLV